MLDRAGYRPNVCIVLINNQNKVLMCRRTNEKAWQFPQGGILHQERPIDAMYRELFEEIGLKADHVNVLGRTKNWLHYDVPRQLIRPSHRGIYRGQKQIWYLLYLVDERAPINLLTSHKPEFDGYEWYDYWTANEIVVYFKRDVYLSAMYELFPFLPNY